MKGLRAARAWLRDRATIVLRTADQGRARYALLWLAILMVLTTGAALRIQGGGVTSDLLRLLPAVREDPLLARAINISRKQFLQKLTVAVEGRNAGSVAAAAQSVRKRLVNAGLDVGNPGAVGSALTAFYRRHRFLLLTPADAHAMQKHPERTFIARLDAGLAMPGSPGGTRSDPGGFLAGYLSTLPRPYPALLPEHGLLAVPQAPEPAYLVSASLRGEAFSSLGEEQARRARRIARSAVKTACGSCRVYVTSPALYSAAERIETRQEVSWLSTAGTVLIVLLVLLVFGSIRPLLLTVACVGGGILAGAATTLILFKEINLLTLVFGTTLLGIAVDYAFHYLTDHRLSSDSATLERVAPGLTLGLITSVLAFAFLAVTPFPALRQIATFSIAGLTGACATVFTLFPFAAGRRTPRSAPRLMYRLAALSVGHGRGWRVGLTVAVLAVTIGGVFRLGATDDLRELQAMPVRLVAQTRAIDALLGTPAADGFLLVRGDGLEQALARERTLDARAAKQLPAAVLVGLAGFVPSAVNQRASLAAWRMVMGGKGARLEQAVRAAKLPVGLVKRLVYAWQNTPRRVFPPAALLAATPALAAFMVHERGETGLVVQVYGHAPAVTLQRLAARLPGVTYVDPLSRLNAAFAGIRRDAAFWVAIGYLVIFLLLIARYGPRGGSAAMIPPLAAAMVTLGVLGWLGQPINVFVVVGLMLVAGIGVDYAVFLREGAGRHRAATGLAVALAAVTTLASFGLLGVSRIPSIHAFGLTVATGIVVCWLAAPLALVGQGSHAQ